MEIIFSDEFKKDFKKIKNKDLRIKIIKQIRKIEENPEVGKPLRNVMKNHKVLRVHPFRIIYRIEQDKLIINCFDHRDDAYG